MVEYLFLTFGGPAVLTDPPKATTKRLEDKFIKITRTAESQINVQKNTVDVKFDIIVENKDYKILKKEIHKRDIFLITSLNCYVKRIVFIFLKNINGSVSMNQD